MNMQPLSNLMTSALGNVWNKYFSNSPQVWDRMYAHAYANKMDSKRQQARNYMLAGIITSSGMTRPRILDVGCGNGALLKALGRHSVDYSGMDVSKKAIAQAEHTLSSINARFTVGDFRALELGQESDSFDFIVFNEVLYYFAVAEIQDVLTKAQSLLSPRGEILISMSTNPKAVFIWSRCLRLFEPRFELFVKSGAWNAWKLKSFPKQALRQPRLATATSWRASPEIAVSG